MVNPSVQSRRTSWLALAGVTALAALSATACAQSVVAPWDSVGRILKAPPAPTGGYIRYNFPRRDITLKVNDVTVSPALALGAWAGFSGDGGNATMMGDLVLLSAELAPVLAELARQHVAVTAIHNHLAGESPQITYVHFHADGNAIELAARLDRVLAQSATPRPVITTPAATVTIDSALVFRTLGVSGRAQGNVAQVSVNLVPGDVTMHGRVVNPALGYATPINIQMAGPNRAVATGDFSVLGTKLGAVTSALAAHGITATAVHSHLVDEQPQIRYVHFWADGPLLAVLSGLRAALDAGR